MLLAWGQKMCNWGWSSDNLNVCTIFVHFMLLYLSICFCNSLQSCPLLVLKQLMIVCGLFSWQVSVRNTQSGSNIEIKYPTINDFSSSGLFSHCWNKLSDFVHVQVYKLHKYFEIKHVSCTFSMHLVQWWGFEYDPCFKPEATIVLNL